MSSRIYFNFLLLLFSFSLINFGKAFAQQKIILENDNQEIQIGKSIYYLKDQKQHLTFEQITSPEFDKQFVKSEQNSPNFGNVETVWNKFKIVNHSEKKWFLTVENYHIDTLTFYYSDPSGKYHKIVLGSSWPFSERKYKVRQFIFDLPVPINDSAICYLKVEAFVFQYPLTVVSEERFLEKNQNKNLALGIYFGFLILIILFNSGIYISFRDKSCLYYILYVALTGMMLLEQEGLTAAFSGEKLHFFWIKTSFIIALASASIFLFTKSFLETKKNAPLLHKIINYFFLPGTFLAVIFDLFGNKLAASISNQFFGFFGLIFLFVTALFIYQKGFKPARFYLVASSFYFIGILVFILKTNAILPHNNLTNASLEIGSILEMILFSFSLGDKINLVRHEKENVERKLGISELEKQSAEKSKEFKSQFLANMSHEIRTPMNAIIGMTNLTLSTSTTPKQQLYLNAVKKSSENLLVIINDILDLSKLEAGKMELETIPFRLADVIEQVHFCMQFKAEEKGLLLTRRIDSDVPPILIGDPLRLNQVLINLVGNAIKFTAKGEVKIIIEAEKEIKGSVRFRIIDTGIGIPKDKIGLLFENFSQVDSSTTRKFGGTGLGLTISKTLIELHKGKIIVTSEEGKGSDFSFVIPFETSNENNLESGNLQENDYSSLHGIKILVADDNKYNQIVAQDTLESLVKDVIVEIADNGKIAIEKHLANDYDIILMDIQMPEMSGTEATEYIRTKIHGTKQVIPILALTASVLEKDIKRFLDCGMNGYIPKPFKREELLNALVKHYKNEKTNKNDANFVKGKEESRDELPIAFEGNVTDLTFLKEFCEGDRIRMKKYIELYLNGTPENLKKIEEAFSKKDYSALSRVAHSIKPHFNYMGMKKAKELCENMENYSPEKDDFEQIPFLIIQLKEACSKSFEELGKFISCI